jgi:hypothetical protein
LITIPNVVNDLLIFPAYFNRSPEAAVIFCLYDPAKSTKCNFGVFKTCIPFIYVFIDIAIVNIECERDDYLFIIVYPTCLFLIPVFKQSSSFN